MSVSLGNLMSEIETKLKTDIHTILENEVGDRVREIIIDHVHSDVYGVNPNNVLYERRGGGGMGNIEFNKKEMEGDLTLVVTNEVPSNTAYGGASSNNLGSLIEYGQGGGDLTYRYPYRKDHTESQYLSARPFMGNTIKELQGGSEVKDLISSGLSSRGYKVS